MSRLVFVPGSNGRRLKLFWSLKATLPGHPERIQFAPLPEEITAVPGGRVVPASGMEPSVSEICLVGLEALTKATDSPGKHVCAYTRKWNFEYNLLTPNTAPIISQSGSQERRQSTAEAFALGRAYGPPLQTQRD